MAFDDQVGLLMRIRADASQALSEIKKTESGVHSFATISGGHAQTLQKDFKSLASEMSNLTAIFTGDRLTGATSQITSFGNAVSALPGPAGIAVGSVAAIATAAVGLTATLLALTKETAETGSQIHDLSEETGLTAETISSLKVAADQSGSSIEGISKGVTRFTLLMGEAAKGSTDAQLKLKGLGVTATDLDTAFAQAVKRIYELPLGLQQNAAAADAFGRKLGADLIPVINQFHGDLPGLIAESKRLGLTWSKEDVDAADQFGDEMTLLDKQFQTIKLTLGKDLMPVFLEFANNISNWLAKNKGEVKGWADYVAETIRQLILQFQQEKNDAAGLGVLGEVFFGIGQKEGETALELYRRRMADVQKESLRIQAAQANKQPFYTGVNEQVNELTARPPTLAGPSYTDVEAEKKRTEELKKAAEERRKIREKEVQEAIASAEKSNRAYLANEREQFQLEQETIEKSFLDHESTAEEYRNKSVANIKKYSDTVKGLIANAFAIDAAQAKNQADMDAAEQERDRANAALKREVNKEASDAIKNIDAQRKKAADDEQKRIKDEEEALVKLQKQWEAEGQAVIDRITQQNELIRAQTELILDQGRQMLEDVFGGDQAPVITSPFDSWTGSFKDFYDTVMEFGPTLSETINGLANIATDAFGRFANALSSVVEQWVLTGETGPAVMRKILATALATLAAEAAVRALWELALGFASLFFNPAEAAAHFTAAAIFGTIAGIAAIAGRAIASDAFKKQTGAATGKSTTTTHSTEGQGGAYSSYGTKAAISEQGRNQPGFAGIPMTMTVKIKDDARWLGQMLQFDFDTNGPARRIIREERDR